VREITDFFFKNSTKIIKNPHRPEICWNGQLKFKNTVKNIFSEKSIFMKPPRLRLWVSFTETKICAEPAESENWFFAVMCNGFQVVFKNRKRFLLFT
jgi:hypothetical protein